MKYTDSIQLMMVLKSCHLCALYTIHRRVHLVCSLLFITQLLFILTIHSGFETFVHKNSCNLRSCHLAISLVTGFHLSLENIPVQSV